MRAAVAEPDAPPRPGVDWSRFTTVCLDMDGTVLDLRFDNLFWLDLLPRRWGELRGLGLEDAWRALQPRFEAKRGTLDWYCIDHWSEELGLDVAALKHELAAEIRYLPGVIECLERLRARGLRLLLTTNAHPASLSIKAAHTGLARHFDALVSSHEFGVPKESAEFWARLGASHGVDRARTLFVDDSAGVLRAAHDAGVARIFQVLQPDSMRPPHPAVEGFEAILGLRELPV